MINLKDRTNLEKIINLIREVPLRKNNKIKIYREAKIELVNVNVKDIKPLSLYLLINNLTVQENIRQTFLEKYNIDTFRLEEALVIENLGMEFTMIPPIVEFSENDGCEVLLDGQHRGFLSIREKETLNVLRITGISKEYPPIAYPVEWNEINIYNEVPNLEKKKRYRFTEKPYNLFRDFSSLLIGGARSII